MELQQGYNGPPEGFTVPMNNPDDTMPMGRALFLWNQVEKDLLAAKELALAPKAQQVPCARMNSSCWVDNEK